MSFVWRMICTNPFLWVKIEILDLAVFEERRQSYTVVCNMWLFTDDQDIESTGSILLDDLLTGCR